MLPEPVVRDAKTARKLYPEQNLIVHFMQPHAPFVAADLESDGMGSDGDYLWDKARRGEYKREELWDAYKQNLEYVMEQVEELVEELAGKTVITSDHGNYVGERNLYAHPPGGNSDYVRKVPWDVRE